MEKVKVVKTLIETLGWEHAREEDHMNKKDMLSNFDENVVKHPLFKKQKRLNELFNLTQNYNINKDRTAQQVLMWANSLLKPFSLQIRAAEKTYFLEVQNQLLDLIKRKNQSGKIYKDGKGLLKQTAPEKKAKVKEVFTDEFIDDEEPSTAAPSTTASTPREVKCDPFADLDDEPFAHPLSKITIRRRTKAEINLDALDEGINMD